MNKFDPAWYRTVVRGFYFDNKPKKVYNCALNLKNHRVFAIAESGFNEAFLCYGKLESFES